MTHPKKNHGLYALQGYLALTVTLLLLSGCMSPTPTISPLRLPTRMPTSTPTPPNPQFYYEQGKARRAAGNTEGALAALSQALASDPTFAPAYIERGALYLALGKAEAALADAQAAVAVDPESGAAHALLGEVLRLGFGDLTQALSAYDRAAQLDPALAETTFYTRWQTAVAAGNGGRMLALSEEYQTAFPQDPMAAYYRGLALIATGSPHAAIRELVKALQGGGPAAVWFVLGEAYRAEGAWPQAGICYEHVRTLAEAGDPSFSLISDDPVTDLFARLGETYLYEGECTSARIMLEHTLAVGAQSPGIHTLIGQAMICQTPTPTPTPYPWMSQ